jgi:hypothetical protein
MLTTLNSKPGMGNYLFWEPDVKANSEALRANILLKKKTL